MSAIKKEDFKGILYISDSEEIGAKLSAFIDFKEPIYFREFLTKDGYDDYLGNKTKYNGLLNETTTFCGLKKAVKYFIWVEFIERQQTVSSDMGMVAPKLQNSEQSLDLWLLTDVYNQGVQSWNDCIDYMESQSVLKYYTITYKERLNVFGI